MKIYRLNFSSFWFWLAVILFIGFFGFLAFFRMLLWFFIFVFIIIPLSVYFLFRFLLWKNKDAFHDNIKKHKPIDDNVIDITAKKK